MCRTLVWRLTNNLIKNVISNGVRNLRFPGLKRSLPAVEMTTYFRDATLAESDIGTCLVRFIYHSLAGENPEFV